MTQDGDAEPGSPSPDRLLIEYLREHDAPCPLCGYNLRRLTIPRCPECGQLLRIGVHLADQSLNRHWFICTISLCLAGGVGLLVCLVMLKVVLTTGNVRTTFHGLREWIIMTLFFAAVPLSLLVVLNRRRFLKMADSRQKAAAVLAVLYSGLEFAAFGIWMR